MPTLIWGHEFTIKGKQARMNDVVCLFKSPFLYKEEDNRNNKEVKEFIT